MLGTCQDLVQGILLSVPAHLAAIASLVKDMDVVSMNMGFPDGKNPTLSGAVYGRMQLPASTTIPLCTREIWISTDSTAAYVHGKG